MNEPLSGPALKELAQLDENQPLTRRQVDALIEQRLDELLPARVESCLAEQRENRTRSMTIIATRGTLDWAYPPFILASTAGALGWNVSIFFTFYGLQLLRKDLDFLTVSGLGNPAMPMKMPMGPDWFKEINWQVPNALQSIVPGFEAMATGLMKKTMEQKGIASVQELRQAALEADVKLIGCQMTIDLFGFERDEFIPEVADYCGAATFLPTASEADVSLFM